MGKETAVPPRPLLPHTLQLENKSARKREATQSWFPSLPPHASSEGLMQGHCMGLYLVYFLVLSVSHSFGSWVLSTSHITAGFHHVAAVPSFPLALMDSWAQHKKTQQSPSPSGSLWISAPLGSVRRDHCLTVWGSISSPLTWEALFIFFLCPAYSSTDLFIFFNQFYILVCFSPDRGELFKLKVSQFASVIENFFLLLTLSFRKKMLFCLMFTCIFLKALSLLC